MYQVPTLPKSGTWSYPILFSIVLPFQDGLLRLLLSKLFRWEANPYGWQVPEDTSSFQFLWIIPICLTVVSYSIEAIILKLKLVAFFHKQL